MPTAATEDLSKTPDQQPGDEVARLVEKWWRWRTELKYYWPEMDKCQEMYEFYKREGSETTSDVGLNTAFAIVESMVSRLNDTVMQVTVTADGTNDMSGFERYVANILKKSVFDAKVAKVAGPFRKTKEIFEREFLVKGNAVAEVSYCYIQDADGRTVTDNPCVRVLPLKSVVFQPWKTLMTSEEYFVEKYVTWDELKSGEKDPVTGKGIYDNLGELLLGEEEDTKLTYVEDQMLLSDGTHVQRQAPPVHILEYHKGAHLIVIANRRVKIRDAQDPFKTGTHNLLTAMNYAIEGRPYAYGEISAIYKPVRAQDTILNQRIETINQYLRGTVFVDPNLGPDLDTVALLLESGGVGYGTPETVNSLNKPLPPSEAYTETSELQNAIERTARFSPYAAGTPTAGTDTTEGTKGGILALQGAAEPNFQVKIDGITDMFLTPLCQLYLPMIANLMDKNEIRWSDLQNHDGVWIGATKNILSGKLTLQDELTVGAITQQQFFQMTHTAVTDPQTGQPSLDPDSGQPLTMPIPGAATAKKADQDWIVTVALDMKSATDRMAKLANAKEMITFLLGIGLHVSPARTATFFENKMEELKGLDEIILTPQEMQQMSSEMPREQLRVNVNFSDLPPEGQVQAAAQAGISLNTGDINAHEATKALMTHGSELSKINAQHAGKAAIESAKAAAAPAPVVASPQQAGLQSNQ